MLDVDLAKFIFLFFPLPIPSLLSGWQIFFILRAAGWGGGGGGGGGGHKKLGPQSCTLDPARKGKRAVWAPAGSSLHLSPGEKSGRAPAIASRVGWAASRGMYACRQACMQAGMHACMHARTHAWMHACMHPCMYVCVCMYVCM